MKQIISNRSGLKIMKSKQVAMKDITSAGERNYLRSEYLFKYLPSYSPQIVRL